MDCDNWYAWYNRMPGGDDPLLRVTGTCEVEEGQSCELVLGNEGIIDEEDLVALELRVTDGGGSGGTCELSWEGDVGPDIKRVRIQGAASAEIEVEITC